MFQRAGNSNRLPAAVTQLVCLVLLMCGTTVTTAQTAPAWTFCADEGAFCSFTGTRQVRYGANATYTVKTITAANGGVACNNATFGDPLVNVAKHCEVDGSARPSRTPNISSFNAAPTSIAAGASTTLSWNVSNATRITIDNGVGRVTGTRVTVSPTTTTTYTLSARNFFGTVNRSVRVNVTATQPPPVVSVPTINSFSASPASITTGASSILSWSVSNAETISITPLGTVTGTSISVQPTQSTTYVLTATSQSGSVSQTLQVAVNPPVPPPDHSAMGPYIDRSKIPAARPGFSDVRVRTTTEQPAGPYDNGSFRTVCDFSHMNFDDPLVYPNQPGAAHLHVFFGNTGVTAASTANSIANSGNSTCRGGIINRSAYWVPAVIDTRDGAPVVPMSSNFYYKTGFGNIPTSQIQPLPTGLRMIAGDAKASGPQDNISWKCNGGYPGTKFLTTCNGDHLVLEIVFPQCWDGKNVDSPDHKSHMSYRRSGGICPSTHPVAIPEITFNISFPITDPNAPQRWRLSSDMYDTSKPGGYSAHGDWFNGWQDDIKDIWNARCNQPSLDCHSHLLGDGRAIY